ncbi:MAG: M48 family metallopeptidase, partial [Alphaproteobacteria bacterium]
NDEIGNTMAAIGLSSHIWNNNIRSGLLLALYPLIIMVLVWGIAWVLGLGQSGSYIRITENGYATGAINPVFFANQVIFEYWPAILSVIIIWFLISFFFNTAMIRALSHAKPVNRAQEPELYNLLENLCITRGITMPKLNIIETDALNAFASGINQSSYTVTVTRGLVNALEKDEMEAVLGHELTHIINRDVRLLIVTVIFTGMIGFAAQLAWSNLRYGMLYRGGNSRNRGNGMFLMLAVAAILWIGYMATLFTRFAISRRREYMADAGSIELTKNPDAMMRALMRISGRDRIPGTPEDIAMMCIENAKPFIGLFATHPPIESRIRAIAQITNTPLPELAGAAAPPESKSRNPWLRKRG